MGLLPSLDTNRQLFLKYSSAPEFDPYSMSILSLRGSVNFDQGNPKETTQAHLDPKPGETAGGFAETVANVAVVGGIFVDTVVKNWPQWQNGVPAQR